MQTILLSLMLILPSQLAAEKGKDPNNEADEALRASAAATAKEFVGRCEFSAGETGNTKLGLHPEPILRWSNPTIGKVIGEVFVWTDNGRPTLIGSWYHWFTPDWGRTLEVTSLAPGRIAGRIEDIHFWNSEKGGVTFKALSNADAPAKTPAARLVQMRRLAGDFVAHLADTRSDDAAVKRQLRMLTQPIFRYPAPNDKATYIDGALFAFVEGTDPEVFLMLEAISTKAGASWQFGLARMNGDALRVTFRDQEVWSVARLTVGTNLSKEPYAFFSPQQIPLGSGINDKKPAPAPKLKP